MIGNSWMRCTSIPLDFPYQSLVITMSNIKKLINLRMEEGPSMNAHLHVFNTIFNQLATQKATFEDNVKAMFLLVTLPELWDTFRTAISNLVPIDELISTNVKSNLLTKGINKKTNAGSKFSSEMVVRDLELKPSVVDEVLMQEVGYERDAIGCCKEGQSKGGGVGRGVEEIILLEVDNDGEKEDKGYKDDKLQRREG
ncbi:hypothetical protein L7F22_000414 [Adiantum nelumboides]|nr:hypothetical protein [Adiantum nelumboides]